MSGLAAVIDVEHSSASYRVAFVSRPSKEPWDLQEEVVWIDRNGRQVYDYCDNSGKRRRLGRKLLKVAKMAEALLKERGDGLETG